MWLYDAADGWRETEKSETNFKSTKQNRRIVYVVSRSIFSRLAFWDVNNVFGLVLIWKRYAIAQPMLWRITYKIDQNIDRLIDRMIQWRAYSNWNSNSIYSTTIF